MRLDAHFDMLPERAFTKRGFGRAPATLEGGKGGGGGPTQTTAYQTNLPEYAKPYVMNMLGAAQNQLFTTSGDQLTGFKPYTPYSNDPTNYFAGPSSLQRSTYNEAGGMGTPGQFAPATGMSAMSGMGQLGTAGQAGMYGQQGAGLGLAGTAAAAPAFGAGQQYSSQVTNPNAVGSYMSPYQQQVTDIAKADAVRNAQIAQQQANLGSARQGTYGGARQALAQSEREKNLMGNLSNIQAQGSQSAYDRAIQNMQYGSNLGLQGIQTGLQGVQAGMQGIGQGLQGVGAQQAGYAGANQAASTLGQLGSSQQQADLARMGFQNQLGGQQQQYQQGIINQAIQDYATQQQYPYMQLSTMSNLLRGLPMQNMSTQQYQAQAPVAQQAAGLLGAYGAYRGGFAEGGTIRGLEDKIDDIGDAGGTKGLQGLLAKTTSPGAKELIMERMREEGIAAGNVGKLGTNMAGGGIIAFERGGNVEGMTDEERAEYIKNNPYLQRSLGLTNLPEKTGNFLRKYNPITGSAYSEGIANFFNESPEDQATKFRKASSRKDQAANPTQEVLAVKTATQRQEDSDRADALASIGQYSKADYNKAKENLMASAGPSASDKGKDTAGSDKGVGVNAGAKVNDEEALARYLKATGQDQTPQEMTDYLNMLKEKSGKVGEMSSEAGRMNKALAFLEAGSTPGGLGAAAIAGGKSFLKGEAANREKYDKIELEYGKAQNDYRKAEIERSKGNYDAAMKFEDKAKDREKDIAIAQMQIDRPGEFEKMYAKFAEGEVAAGRKPSFESFRKAYSGADEDLVRLDKAEKAVNVVRNDLSPGGYMQLAASKKPEDRQKAAQLLAAVYQRYGIDPTTGSLTGSQTAGGKIDSANPLLKG